MTVRKSVVLLIAVLVVFGSAGVATASSASSNSTSLSVSTDAPTAVEPGSTFSVAYTVSNTGDSSKEGVLDFNSSVLPAGAEVVEISGEDPSGGQFAVIKNPNATEIVYSEIAPGENVSGTFTVRLPQNITDELSLSADFITDDAGVITTSHSQISISSPLEMSADDTEVVQGETTEITFSVQNTGPPQEAVVDINETTIPDGWNITGLTGSSENTTSQFDGIANPNESEVVFSEVSENNSVTATVEISVPSQAAPDTYQIGGAVLVNDGNVADHSIANVTVTKNVTEKYDQDNNGLDSFEVLDAITDFKTQELSSFELLKVIQSW
ncbi:hypothetical protein LPA44_14035 [Halobacterium sp. KA-4]|uniref:hypothetical protein n=1 Tax=Halobacterium sp. KA-4 TaxID=2896367 RepID=UPI001E34D682|nr:hypothetical protein [Halobacterium sp. KA-4]MCD2201004.1 hypothetical protein [Halobacterium sp. KA-4]